MRRAATIALALAALALVGAPAAQASFGLLPGSEGFDVFVAGEGGKAPDTLAGSHPYSVTTTVNFKRLEESASQPGAPFTDGDVRDLHLALPPGLVENPAAAQKCSAAQFHTPRQSPFPGNLSGENCPNQSQIGVIQLRSSFAGGVTRSFGVFNLNPPDGVPSQMGFAPFGVPVTLAPHIRQAEGEYGLTLDLRDFPQQLDVYGFTLTLWGDPWNRSHDGERGNCLNEAEPGFPLAKCPFSPPAANHKPWAYLTLPTSCNGPMAFTLSASSWQQPGTVERSAVAGDGEGHPLDVQGCDSLFFQPEPLAQASSTRASTPSGFEFILRGNGQGFFEPDQRSNSQVKTATVRLPEGMTINPSVGAGLGVCTPAQYAAETVSSAPGEGCPNASKIGVLEVESPLLETPIEGALFFAQPDDPASGEPGAENPFDTLLALYMVAKSPERGVLVKVAGKVVPDPATGRLTATFDNLPQLPYSHFDVLFRDGQRSPLATPASCGDYATEVGLTPWTHPTEVDRSISRFGIVSGLGAGPCPSGPEPFKPSSEAGTANSNAGSYTPFFLHLTRADGEQEITSYSAQLPPGLLGKISGIPYCPEAAIEAAKQNTGFGETAHPSCPKASEIGHTVTGYGLASVLAYAPGKLYLAGPYHGSPVSVVAVDSATVGPFDLGVIVIRSAIRVDRRSAQVAIDSAGSDPIPHIIDGFPLRLRDIRVYLDKPGFTINPTSCDHFGVTSTLTGSGARFSDPSDDSLAQAPSPFQVFNCQALPFAPRLNLRLRGGIKRGNYPSLEAVVRPRPGEAGFRSVAVTLPASEFLAQEHIGTVCTRPQFAADACPAASVYGQARAVTPLLGEPLEGPVYLRSSDHTLPDIVADLRAAGIEIELVGRIDSKDGGIRASFEALPDAPVSKFTMSLVGGKRGILVNADNLCRHPGTVVSRMLGQNNRGFVSRTLMGADCGKGKGKKKGKAKPGKRRPR